MKGISFSKKLSTVLITAVLAVVLTLTCFVVNEGRGKASAAGSSYTSDYSAKKEAKQAGLDLNEKIAQEGMVLLKNENNALPLSVGKGTDATRVSLFGYKSIKSELGGGGNVVGDASAGIVKSGANFYNSLESAGYVTNPVIKGVYQSGLDVDALGAKNATQEKPYAAKYVSDTAFKAAFTAAQSKIRNSYNQYGDAAIVVLGVEELTAAEQSNATNTRHRLKLSAAQLALVTEAAENFETVIVFINSSYPLEIDAIKDNADVDAIVVIGEPGDNGLIAAGQILSGQVNPSGRLADLYPVDFTKAPSYNNYNNGLSNKDNLAYFKADKTTKRNAYIVDYEEGIYVGYRYYETRGYEETKAAPASTWYDDSVAYPFGYGLSYTTFDWVVTPKLANNATITKDSVIKVDVTVENTGNVAGKDVVQLYYTAPYGTETTNATKIEKPYVALGDFAKTELLQPGQSETVTLTIKASDMASYDYKVDKTYVLDDGNYSIKLMKNSHEVDTALTYTVAAKVLCDKAVTGETVENRFDDVNTEVDARQNMLSRADLSKVMTAPTADERVLTDEQFKAWAPVVNEAYDKDAKWESKTMPKVDDPTKRTAAKAPIQLNDLIGKDFDSPMWEKLLDQLSYQEMKDLIENGGFGTISIDYIGKPRVTDTDGPKGWTGNGKAGSEFNKFSAAPLIASTFSKDLAFEMGKMIGEQGLWGSSDREDGGKISTYTGWYSPAMNTHRSPFDSRFTEYYSEDGYLAGMMAANASLGAKSKGCYVFIKHFALHDDGGGTNFVMLPGGGISVGGYRGTMGPGGETSGLSVWCNEQAMREIYFKPFQIAVEKGSASAVMSSFSRIGKIWAGGSYALLTEILRDEWGFNGVVVTDIAIYPYVNADQMIRAGGDLVLSGSAPLSDSRSATQITSMRKACKNILYTVANSNAMQIPLGASVVYESETVKDAKVKEAYTGEIGTAALNTAYAYSSLTYAVTGGRLPDGLKLSAGGQITGTPTRAGDYTFTVTASAAGYQAADFTYTMTVNPEKSIGEIVDGSAGDISGSIDAGGKDTNAKIDKVSGDLSAVNMIVIISLVIGALALVAAGAAAVLVFLKKKN